MFFFRHSPFTGRMTKKRVCLDRKPRAAAAAQSYLGPELSIKSVAMSKSPMDGGLFGFWLRFGSVTGFFKPASSPEPRQKPKILAAYRYSFSVNALSSVALTGL